MNTLSRLSRLSALLLVVLTSGCSFSRSELLKPFGVTSSVWENCSELDRSAPEPSSLPDPGTVPAALVDAVAVGERLLLVVRMASGRDRVYASRCVFGDRGEVRWTKLDMHYGFPEGYSPGLAVRAQVEIRCQGDGLAARRLARQSVSWSPRDRRVLLGPRTGSWDVPSWPERTPPPPSRPGPRWGTALATLLLPITVPIDVAKNVAMIPVGALFLGGVYLFMYFMRKFD